MKLKDLMSKIENVESQLQQHNQKAVELDQAKATTHAFIHTLNGALQAYEDMKKALESEIAGDLVDDAASVIDAVSQ